MKNNTSGNFSEKMMEWVNRFANSKAILSLKDGFVLTMPITLIGSIFMLIGNFPIPGWETFMAGIFGPGWQEPLNQVTGATFDIIALIAVFGIAYYWAKHSNVDAVPAGLLALVSFLIITDSFVALPEEVMNAISNEGVALQTISGVIPKSWTGGQGMVTAILVGFLVGAIYSWFVRHKITIKMPESVPEGVSNAFSALIPGVVIVTLFLLLYIIFDMLAGKTLTAIIYQILQLPDAASQRFAGRYHCNYGVNFSVLAVRAARSQHCDGGYVADFDGKRASKPKNCGCRRGTDCPRSKRKRRYCRTANGGYLL